MLDVEEQRAPLAHEVLAAQLVVVRGVFIGDRSQPSHHGRKTRDDHDRDREPVANPLGQHGEIACRPSSAVAHWRRCSGAAGIRCLHGISLDERVLGRTARQLRGLLRRERGARFVRSGNVAVVGGFCSRTRRRAIGRPL